MSGASGRIGPVLTIGLAIALTAASCGGDSQSAVTTDDARTDAALDGAASVASDLSDAGSGQVDDVDGTAAGADEATGGPDESPAAGDESAPVITDTDIPDLDFVDVTTGEVVNLRSFIPSDTPLLFWFWAPH